ncbi:energy-coupling factor transporter transmembrane component T family protein [Methanimicrococcus blatticola]|uniref:Energy-coupling factor transport system permease protein n=1 Tax=Methanimicrococcus blatticola TaxID=91560 RepID=A0A484F467_9EURY|nr:energy-coupling factor transporter transmembrane component T [Methanimicrococcus blatticola]MBZ3935373.1 energy-coupling factor transporter transmembrane protein EcfT [Methanimicrococcus blatticola]MCC2508529.1 energy-coupling factor transporter transmembrane protein EcfT [Methanimicrococcus blatticola]TDQ67836.1 energy-coupling factor transport system permease protein [Methanimicrococcus blatticola]
MDDIMQYTPGNGLFHKLNAMTKIVFAVGMLIAAVMTENQSILAGMIVFIAILAIVSGLGKALLKQLPILIILGILLVLLTILTMKSGDVLFNLIPIGAGYIPVTMGAITFAVTMILRFTVLISSFQLLVISTKPSELVNALYVLHVPSDYALMFLIAIRFIPTLQREGVRINEAQLSRGYNPGGGFIGKLKQTGPVMLPLMLNSLAKADTLGLTIDMRGYRKAAENKRKIKYKALDLMMIAIVSAILILTIAIGFGLIDFNSIGFGLIDFGSIGLSI